jgi:imidazoleglycerol-phosphate dehydratase
MTRTASLDRVTLETKVTVELELDGTGTSSISTGVGFFDHLLTSLSHHSLIDVTIDTEGDLHIDDHHTVEDTALVLGGALAAALGTRAGLARYGDASVPMDEALARCALDVGGRPYSVIDLPFGTERIGNLTTQNIPHALAAFARTAGFTLHLSAVGANDHHVAEATFKALARALRSAISIDPRREGVASTKGVW